MGSMMTLLSLYLSTHIPLFLCVSVSKSALSSSLHSVSAPGWGGGFPAQMAAYLTWPLNVIHVHWSDSAPQLVLTMLTKHNTTLPLCIKYDPISPIVLNSTGTSTGQCITDCISNIHSHTRTCMTVPKTIHTLILIPELPQSHCEWWDWAEMEINELSLQPW